MLDALCNLKLRTLLSTHSIYLHNLKDFSLGTFTKGLYLTKKSIKMCSKLHDLLQVECGFKVLNDDWIDMMAAQDVQCFS